MFSNNYIVITLITVLCYTIYSPYTYVNIPTDDGRAGPSALATPFQRVSWEMETQGFLRGS